MAPLKFWGFLQRVGNFKLLEEDLWNSKFWSSHYPAKIGGTKISELKKEFMRGLHALFFGLCGGFCFLCGGVYAFHLAVGFAYEFGYGVFGGYCCAY
jgi:hypothetical protein